LLSLPHQLRQKEIPIAIILTIEKFFLFENFSNIYYKSQFNSNMAKTMTEQEFCNNCNQKHNCGSIYHQLGNIEGPSVVVKVVIAFLLPLVVFIISLAAFQEIFTKTISSQGMQTILCLVSALLVTFSYILIVKVINKRLGQIG
jgi:hypothetical protein